MQTKSFRLNAAVLGLLFAELNTSGQQALATKLEDQDAKRGQKNLKNYIRPRLSKTEASTIAKALEARKAAVHADSVTGKLIVKTVARLEEFATAPETEAQASVRPTEAVREAVESEAVTDVADQVPVPTTSV